MKVNINTSQGKYRLRFTYNDKRYSLSIGQVNKETLKAAKAKAKLIESDIMYDRFDMTLRKYSHRHRVVKEPHTILSKWEDYKRLNAKRIAITTQKECWTQVDRCLAKIKHKSHLFSLDKADELVNELLNYYSPGTLKRVLININAAASGYYPLKKLPKTNKPLIECFTNFEIKSIIEAFENNTFKSPYTDYFHDYYTNYIKFLAYTGCRPEEAIALTWNDISTTIKFDKAYSKGVLKDTKNHKIRDFPINNQLIEVLEQQKNQVTSKLVFPSVCGGYINHRDWSRRYWRPIVRSLANCSEINSYKKPYTLRHSFITRCIRTGLDIASVAEISGNTTETIMRYYLASRDISEIDLPSI